MPAVFLYIFVGWIGLALGSFASAISYRVPKGIPWVYSPEGACRSACPSCGARLTLRDLVPVFSWLASQGKCRHCKKPISNIYLLIEILTAICCVGVLWSWGFSLSAALLIFCIPFLVSLLVIDLQSMILPNQLVLVVAVFGLLRLWTEIFWEHNFTLPHVLFEYGAGAIGYFVFAWALAAGMSKLLNKEALGGGDVKFFAVAGLWLGISKLGLFCIFSGTLGVALALVWRLLKKGGVFPFGPALIASLYLLLIFERFFQL